MRGLYQALPICTPLWEGVADLRPGSDGSATGMDGCSENSQELSLDWSQGIETGREGEL